MRSRVVARLAGWLAIGGLVAATRAHAGDSGPTFLAWGSCASAPGATTCAPFDCNGAGSSVYVLVGTFEVSIPMTHVQSMIADVDVEFPDRSTVPNFWDVSLGGCNPSAFLGLKGRAEGCESVLNAFCGGDSTLCDVLYSTVVTAKPNRLRIALSLARAELGGVSFEPAPQRYFAFGLSIPMTGAVQCSGCPERATAVWNSATIFWLDDNGVPQPPVTLSGGYTGASPLVSINDKSAGCATSPVERTTWGQLKRLYR